MSKDPKYAFWKEVKDRSVDNMFKGAKNIYLNKYYNLWMSKFIWKGLDEEERLADQQEEFIMRKFWADGSVACFEVKNTGLLGFAPFAAKDINAYGQPVTVNLTNIHGSPQVPSKVMTVNKDVVLGYCAPNRKGIATIVSHYVDLLVQLDMIMDNNSYHISVPFLISTTPENKKRMEDLVTRIKNRELVIHAESEDFAQLQAFVSQAPYLLAELQAQKYRIEQEIFTYLGIDTVVDVKTHLSVDMTNANNMLIRSYEDAIVSEMDKFCRMINRVFGRNVSIKLRQKPVDAYHEVVHGKEPGDAADDNKGGKKDVE